MNESVHWQLRHAEQIVEEVCWPGLSDKALSMAGSVQGREYTSEYGYTVMAFRVPKAAVSSAGGRGFLISSCTELSTSQSRQATRSICIFSIFSTALDASTKLLKREKES